MALQNIKTKKNLIGLIHKVYITLLKKRRKHTAHSKIKSEVRGGGRKPWRQKGTGQARAGSIRSPLWKGGGVSFGPRHHLVSIKINKKEKRKALFAALFLKQKNITFLEKEIVNAIMTNHKTKTFLDYLKKFNISKYEKTLIILNNISANIKLAVRNLYYIDIITPSTLNLESVLQAKKILIETEAKTELNLIYGKIF